MNTHDKIELPPFPEGIFLEGIWACPEDELISYRDACIQAAIEAYRKRIAGLEAARFAYASEFPPNEDGDPDVGSIHENIRKLKAKLEAYRKRWGEPAVQSDAEVVETCRAMGANSFAEFFGKTAPQPTEPSRGEPVGYIMPTAIKQLKAGGNAIVGGVSQGGDVAVYLAPQPADLSGASSLHNADSGAQDGIQATQPAEPESTHHVHRGTESLPCYCDGTYDHPIGKETLEPVKVPSDSAIMFEWSQTPNTGDMRVDLVAFARALLARYGNTQQEQP